MLVFPSRHLVLTITVLYVTLTILTQSQTIAIPGLPTTLIIGNDTINVYPYQVTISTSDASSIVLQTPTADSSSTSSSPSTVVLQTANVTLVPGSIEYTAQLVRSCQDYAYSLIQYSRCFCRRPKQSCVGCGPSCADDPPWDSFCADPNFPLLIKSSPEYIPNPTAFDDGDYCCNGVFWGGSIDYAQFDQAELYQIVPESAVNTMHVFFSPNGTKDLAGLYWKTISATPDDTSILNTNNYLVISPRYNNTMWLRYASSAGVSDGTTQAQTRRQYTSSTMWQCSTSLFNPINVLNPRLLCYGGSYLSVQSATTLGFSLLNIQQKSGGKASPSISASVREWNLSKVCTNKATYSALDQTTLDAMNSSDIKTPLFYWDDKTQYYYRDDFANPPPAIKIRQPMKMITGVLYMPFQVVKTIIEIPCPLSCVCIGFNGSTTSVGSGSLNTTGFSTSTNTSTNTSDASNTSTSTSSSSQLHNTSTDNSTRLLYPDTHSISNPNRTSSHIRNLSPLSDMTASIIVTTLPNCTIEGVVPLDIQFTRVNSTTLKGVYNASIYNYQTVVVRSTDGGSTCMCSNDPQKSQQQAVDNTTHEITHRGNGTSVNRNGDNKTSNSKSSCFSKCKYSPWSSITSVFGLGGGSSMSLSEYISCIWNCIYLYLVMGLCIIITVVLVWVFRTEIWQLLKWLCCKLPIKCCAYCFKRASAVNKRKRAKIQPTNPDGHLPHTVDNQSSTPVDHLIRKEEPESKSKSKSKQKQSQVTKLMKNKRVQFMSNMVLPGAGLAMKHLSKP